MRLVCTLISGVLVMSTCFAPLAQAWDPIDSLVYEDPLYQAYVVGEYLGIELKDRVVRLYGPDLELVKTFDFQMGDGQHCELLPHVDMIAVYRNQWLSGVTGAVQSLWTDNSRAELWDIGTGNMVFSHEEEATTVISDVDYSSQLGLMAMELGPTARTSSIIKVVRTSDSELVLEREVSLEHKATIFEDSSLYFVSADRIEEFRLHSDGEMKRVTTHLVNVDIWSGTQVQLHHRTGQKSATVYAGVRDTSVGPVKYSALGSFEEVLRDSLVFHWIGSQRRSYSHDTRTLFLCEEGRTLRLIDLDGSTIRTLVAEELVGEGNWGIFMPFGARRFLAIPGKDGVGALNRILVFEY